MAGHELLFVSGQLGLDPATGALVAGGVGAEARQALTNLAAIVAAATSPGTRLADAAAKTTVLLADIADFAEVGPRCAAPLSRASATPPAL